MLKLGDFGISKALQSESDLLLTKVGTPYFMPPEVIQDKPYDAKADVWSLGVILYEMISGKLPFDGKSMVSILAAISRGKPTAINTAVPGMPKDLAILIMQLLSNDRDERPVDANSVVEQLRAIEKQGA